MSAIADPTLPLVKSLSSEQRQALMVELVKATHGDLWYSESIVAQLTGNRLQHFAAIEFQDSYSLMIRSNDRIITDTRAFAPNTCSLDRSSSSPRPRSGPRGSSGRRVRRN
jgi:hypothetical protein